jgi:hypothetical protein
MRIWNLFVMITLNFFVIKIRNILLIPGLFQLQNLNHFYSDFYLSCVLKNYFYRWCVFGGVECGVTGYGGRVGGGR